MRMTFQEVSEQAHRLQASDKSILIDELIADLIQPNPEVMRQWADEVDARIQSHALKPRPSVTHEELMARLRTP